MMQNKGNLRCIFTRSIHERIDNIRFATLYPTISLCQFRKNFRKHVKVCKRAKKELRRYKPNAYNRITCRIKARIWCYTFLGVLGSICLGIMIALLSEWLKTLLGLG